MTAQHWRKLRHCRKVERKLPPPSDELCECGREKGHRGIHRGGKIEKKGAKNGMTMDQIREIVQSLKSEGKNSIDCAKELGVTLTLINKVW
jgi:hypothetical protein